MAPLTQAPVEGIAPLTRADKFAVLAEDMTPLTQTEAKSGTVKPNAAE